MERMFSKSRKTLSFKITLFFAAVAATLIVILAAISLYAFREFSIRTATNHLRTAAEITRLHLTNDMIAGIIDQRQDFLMRLTSVHGLRSAYVVRSPLLDMQFGKTSKGEYLPDEIEKQVLNDGKPAFVLTESRGELLFRGTIPYVATSDSSPNCLQCHQAKTGDVLGAVTMTMSVTDLRRDAMFTAAGIVGVVALFVLLLFVLLRHLLHPISNTAAAVEEVVQNAINGHFKLQVKKQTEDEIGQIASDLNRLIDFLDSGLNRINNHVAELTHRKPEPGENLLLATIDMVEHLTQVSHFKLAIEEDESKVDIYRRLMSAIQSKFSLSEYSVYEVSSDKSKMQPVIVDGKLETPCRWCDARILSQPGNCRVFHTGRMVDGILQADLCYNFKSSADDAEKRFPLCFPIIQSGSVGSIVQLVVKEGEKARIQTMLPYIHVYLRETAPVLEARRLMETLRESSLRDPMTGLSNRRFLEEYVDTLIANVRRKQNPVTILMLDLDHFKMVNDTYGHDAGDIVLKELALVIKRTVRTSDIVIRYGGEEFLVVLNDTSGQDAEHVAESIRATVEKMRINYGGIVLQKTISIGLADFPIDSNSFWQAVKFADVALYQAKEAGRNRVVRFTPDMWTDPQEY
jgi:diguanylate cyclase (GGDEF)-like protein